MVVYTVVGLVHLAWLNQQVSVFTCRMLLWDEQGRLGRWLWNHISHALKSRYPMAFERDTAARDWLYDESLDLMIGSN